MPARVVSINPIRLLDIIAGLSTVFKMGAVGGALGQTEKTQLFAQHPGRKVPSAHA
jgi:hypothetical protein